MSFNNLDSFSKSVFSEKNGTIYLGGEPVGTDLLDTLKDEARMIANSELWRILHATIINESSNMALQKSTTWEHVQTAKMLFYWDTIMNKLLSALEAVK